MRRVPHSLRAIHRELGSPKLAEYRGRIVINHR